MKNLLVILMLYFCFSCTEETNSTNQGRSKNLDWIVGNWKRTNNQVEKKTFEHWIKQSKSEYIGFGFTLHNQDTIFKENLRILQNEGQWYLEVTGVNENPTLFKFLNQSDSSFVSENKQNEFPKEIQYSCSKNNLTAIISDDDNKILFLFEKF